MDEGYMAQGGTMKKYIKLRKPNVKYCMTLEMKFS